MNGMTAEIVSVDPERPDPAIIERAARLLRAGGLVAFPTETVYGLGAIATDAAAVARIFAAKGRPAHNPIIVHLADRDPPLAIAAEWSERARALADVFWPGPLTLIVPRGPSIPDNVTAGGPTVAVRMPAHPVALALVRGAGQPLAAPSANRSSRVSPTTARHVARSLGDAVDLILDGGPASGGIESTVLDLTSVPAHVLRPGLVSANDLARFTEVTPNSSVPPRQTTFRSPGMLERHYAPTVPTELTDAAAHARVAKLAMEGIRVGLLRFSSELGLPPGCRAIEMPPEASRYAARLYAALHELEEADVDLILIERPPAGAQWLAIHDRLARATCPRDLRSGE